jgi:BCD family chlorophyll transporter-like MFS transporter
VASLYNRHICKNLSKLMPQNLSDPANLSVPRNLKLGTFHIGSALADVLATGVWNRIMINDLGFAATPIGLLLALRYFLAPLAMWAGVRSDQTNLRGYRRLPWVWGGRLGMIAGFLLIAVSTVELVRHGDIWWLGIILGFVVSSIGYSISGSTFLALVYDRAPGSQRGRAVGIVWTFLLAGYAVAGVLFSRMLPRYSESAFLQFSLGVVVILALIWLCALWGEEKPYSTSPQRKPAEFQLRAGLRDLFQQRTVRILGLFMVLSFGGAFMQDALLEPFGGEVFSLSVGETSRFQSYWGTMAILSSIAALWLYRRFSQSGYGRFTRWGVILLVVTFVWLAMTAVTAQELLLRPGLLLLGIGYGLWNIGTLGLMVEHSREQTAGFDLGIWTMLVTVCRGGAIFLGAVTFDVFHWLLGEEAAAYAIVFSLEAILLMVSLVALNQILVTAPERLKAAEGELILSASLD